MAPTVFLGMRMVTTTYLYEDPEHENRVTSTIASPAYTPEDQALLMGLDMYEADLCRCGHSRSVAWHSEMDGWFEGEKFVCHACTAGSEDGKPVAYTIAHSTLPADRVLPEFVLGETTSSP